MRTFLKAFSVLVLLQNLALGELPTANYVFPAGGQRGTTVNARIGGCNLYRAPRLIWSGNGIAAPSLLQPTETVWFEGPVIPQPASQQKEDYPRDFAASLAIAADAPLGSQTWRLATSQGVTTALGFIVGTFPEVIEQEYEGIASAIHVELPVTINGRIFPREDVDTWSFSAKAGQTVTCRVVTSAFGSPLDARIEVRDASGQVLGERIPEGIVTPDLQFVAPSDGEYQVRIHDVGFNGLQDHVYRLTVTAGPVLQRAYPLGGRRRAPAQFQLTGVNLPNLLCTVELPQQGTEFVLRLPDEKTSFGEVRLDLDEFAELLEVEPNEAASPAMTIPCVVNGRIQSPGDVDAWTFTAKKGTEYEFEARAARLGSSLDAVMEIADSTGKRLAEADDSPGIQTDARLRWTSPAEGEFRLLIRDRLASRGGDRFAYRVRAVSFEQPDFALSSITDGLILERGKTANLKISLDRGPGFQGPVVLDLQDLPAGVSVSSPPVPVTIAANQREVQLTLKAEADAKVGVTPLKVLGRATVTDKELVRSITLTPTNPEPGRLALPDGTGSVWLAVAVPTPFKFVGIFETKFIPRGSVFVRKYHIDRNGFDGPLEVHLADRQGRHLQGVNAQTVVVPSGQSDFEFAVKLAPWMEIGRTCRSTLAVDGVVMDLDGSRHDVSYSSNDQNNQMISLVDAGRFAVQMSRTTLVAQPGKRVDVPIRIQRSPGLTGPVSIELVATQPIQGVSAKPIEIAGDSAQSVLTIEFAQTVSGVDVHPLTIRATSTDERGLTVVAEAPLTLVADR